MRQADIVVGQEYARQSSDPLGGPPTAARVRVASIQGRGRVTVVVVDPGPAPAFPCDRLKHRQTLEVTSRSLACRWDEWPAHAADIAKARADQAASQESSWARAEESSADRTRVDSARLLPDRYDDEGEFPGHDDPDERAVIADEYLARRRYVTATPDEVALLIAHIPVPVARDIVSAVRIRGDEDADPNCVSTVFNRAALLLDQARIAMSGRGAPRLPERHALLDDTRVMFVWALHEQTASDGGQLHLPFVPDLPDWLDDERRERAAAFGWLRLAVGDTSGDHLHSTSCHTIRSMPPTEAEHVPLWRVELEHRDNLCAVCGGPNVRDLIAFAHFTAAVDVWNARHRPQIERWQRVAFLRLVAASAESRARCGEPDVTLAARIVDALGPRSPDEEGWAAYAIAAANSWNGLEDRLGSLTVSERETARVLLRDRLTTVEERLPVARRPLPLPAAASEDVLRDRYRQHTCLVEDVPQFDRLLFGLPGAR